MNLDAVNPELESKINDLVCETYNKPFLEQEKLLKEAFELIPKPVTQWAHPTTMVTIALFELYYKNQKYEQAKEWLSIALSVADLGTTNAGTYLLAGIFYYDLEKYDEAYKYFDIAYNDAGYYPFSIEDKKYWQFYKQRKDELNPKKKTQKKDLIFSDDLYQIAINITDPAGYTTSYGYNARWLPETITDTYNTTATNPSYRSAIRQSKTVKVDNEPTTSTATKSVFRAR